MFDFIQFYTTNRNKLLDILIELLYALTIFIVTKEIYGKHITWNTLIIGAQSLSMEFFLDLIGIGLIFLTVALIIRWFASVILSSVEMSISRIKYLKRRAKLNSIKKREYTFKIFVQKGEVTPGLKILADKTFLYVKEERMSELRSYFTKSKFSSLATKLFVILSSFLMISLVIRKTSFGMVQGLVSIGLYYSIVFYYLACNAERIINAPGFYDKVSDNRKLQNYRKILNSNPACYQKLKQNEKGTMKENLYFVYDPSTSSTIVAWIVLVDRSGLEFDFLREIIENTSNNKGVFKVLIDIFDIIPDKYSTKENLKIIKPNDQINMIKEVNALILCKQGN